MKLIRSTFLFSLVVLSPFVLLRVAAGKPGTLGRVDGRRFVLSGPGGPIYSTSPDELAKDEGGEDSSEEDVGSARPKHPVRPDIKGPHVGGPVQCPVLGGGCPVGGKYPSFRPGGAGRYPAVPPGGVSGGIPKEHGDVPPGKYPDVQQGGPIADEPKHSDVLPLEKPGGQDVPPGDVPAEKFPDVQSEISPGKIPDTGKEPLPNEPPGEEVGSTPEGKGPGGALGPDTPLGTGAKNPDMFPRPGTPFGDGSNVDGGLPGKYPDGPGYPQGGPVPPQGGPSGFPSGVPYGPGASGDPQLRPSGQCPVCTCPCQSQYPGGPGVYPGGQFPGGPLGPGNSFGFPGFPGGPNRGGRPGFPHGGKPGFPHGGRPGFSNGGTGGPRFPQGGPGFQQSGGPNFPQGGPALPPGGGPNFPQGGPGLPPGGDPNFPPGGHGIQKGGQPHFPQGPRPDGEGPGFPSVKPGQNGGPQPKPAEQGNFPNFQLGGPKTTAESQIYPVHTDSKFPDRPQDASFGSYPGVGGGPPEYVDRPVPSVGKYPDLVQGPHSEKNSHGLLDPQSEKYPDIPPHPAGKYPDIPQGPLPDNIPDAPATPVEGSPPGVPVPPGDLPGPEMYPQVPDAGSPDTPKDTNENGCTNLACDPVVAQKQPGFSPPDSVEQKPLPLTPVNIPGGPHPDAPVDTIPVQGPFPDKVPDIPGTPFGGSSDLPHGPQHGVPFPPEDLPDPDKNLQVPDGGAAGIPKDADKNGCTSPACYPVVPQKQPEISPPDFVQQKPLPLPPVEIPDGHPGAPIDKIPVPRPIPSAPVPDGSVPGGQIPDVSLPEGPALGVPEGKDGIPAPPGDPNVPLVPSAPDFKPAPWQHPQCGDLKNGYQLRGSFPWQATLAKKVGAGKRYFCAGTLISERHVLTPAHCVDKFLQTVDVLVVHLGNLLRGGEQNVYPVQQIIVNPDYTEGDQAHNIAVVVLAREALLDDEIYPICLPEDTDLDFANFDCSATGWPNSAFKVNRYDSLRKVPVPIMSNDVCQNKIASESSLGGNFELGNTFMCCAMPKGVMTFQACSGGALACAPPSGGRYMCAGVVTVKEDVRMGPSISGMFLRIAPHLAWIRGILERAHEQ